MDESLLNLVLADNQWLRGEQLDTWYSRQIPETYIPRAAAIGDGTCVAVVVGPRQAGKSTLLWQHLAHQNEPALYLNCEEPLIRDWLISPGLFVQDLERTFPKVRTVLFEEIQHLNEAGLFLKGVHDRRTGKRFLATGSSSFDLESATRESLAGRAERHLLLPLSMSELEASDPGAEGLRDLRMRELSTKMTLFGSYPAVWRSSEPGLALAGLAEAFVVRDASDRFRIRHVAAFRKLLQLVAASVGNLCNYSQWAGVLGISADTVADYVQILQDAHVLYLAPPFVGGKRAEIKGTPKVFFVDNGLRNRLFGGFGSVDSRADAGPLLENLVFSELRKTVHPLLDTIRFWRSKGGGEVDFVVEHQGRILPVESKSRPGLKLTRSMHSFIDAYSPPLLLVVNWIRREELQHRDTLVRFVLPWDISHAVREALYE